jgi:hypothetical protein
MDMAKPSCTYCGTVLPHHARAAQQVAVVNQMMADRNGNGIPDAFEGLIANAPHGQVHLIGTSVTTVQGGPVAPPQVTPFGGGHPMGAAHLHQVAVAQSVARTSSIVTLIVVASIFFMMLVGGVVAAIVVLSVNPH